MADVTALFAQAFASAAKHEVTTYANLLRFIGMTTVLIACAFALTHFLSTEAKAHDAFIVNLTSRILKILFGITLFALLLKP